MIHQSRGLAQRGLSLFCHVLVLCLALAPATARAVEPTWERLAGDDRYQTMAAIVEAGSFDAGKAVVTTGEGYPDALVAAGLAGVQGCPVVLTAGGGLSPEARAELLRLGVREAYVVGGPSVVGESVMDELAAEGILARRVYGDDRVETSLAVLDVMRESAPSSGAVVVATGRGFADALSMGPWAYATGSPIVLTDGDGRLSEAAVEAIRRDGTITEAIIVGGASSVSAEVENQLAGMSCTRLAGEDRYETSREVATWAASHGLGWTEPVVATGQNFPDALAGTALAGNRRSVLLLASEGTEPTLEVLFEHRDEVSNGFLLGGRRAVTFDDPTSVVGPPLSTASDVGLRLVEAARTTPFAGKGWCAAWVEDVYDNAGLPGGLGNACDLYDWYCTSDDVADLEAGMIVAVPSHPHTELGAIYGHVGIYLGDGWIADNASRLRRLPLGTWLQHYGATYRPRWGWLGDVG